MDSFCIDLNGEMVSGGTNPKRNLTESKVVVKYQYCGEYETENPVKCSTPDELAKFMENAVLSIKTSDNYIDFSEPDTEKALKARLVEIGRVRAS